MTTMSIQLRRVVYLLVLLQCCVCVAYADRAAGTLNTSNVTSVESSDDLTSRLDELISSVHGLTKDAEKTLDSTKKVTSKCTAALKNVSDAESRVIEFTNEINDLLKKVKDGVINVDDKVIKAEETFQMLELATNVCRETVTNVKKATDNSTTAVATLTEKSNALSDLTEKYYQSLFLITPVVPDVFLRRMQKYEDGTAKAKAAQKVVKDLRSAQQSAQREADTALKKAEEAAKAALLLKEKIEKLRSNGNAKVASAPKTEKDRQEANLHSSVINQERVNEEAKYKYDNKAATSERTQKELITNLARKDAESRVESPLENNLTEGTKTQQFVDKMHDISVNKQTKSLTKIADEETQRDENNGETKTSESLRGHAQKKGTMSEEGTDNETASANHKNGQHLITEKQTSRNSQSETTTLTTSTAADIIKSSNKESYGSLSPSSIALNVNKLKDNSSSPALVHGSLLLLLLWVLGCTLVC
ncbi:uncharacterized protein TM35_000061060 [Trypanosoma theileri]|uniref:Uncharacterized protein n=1 Tax=Trypanosoma theileri TaxID=67003 RepID=A0A1X0P2L2_9TRYP|nr:uncharacterized protein TM35_000061060 [Trypanosoma theileri]ORC91101.1 hypothetical protein TM35_000061060 [Trypanosoma theileri]